MKDYTYLQAKNSGLRAKLGLMVISIDGFAFIPLVVLPFHVRPWSIGVCVSFILIFIVFEKLGYPRLVALRKIRSMIAGRYRASKDVVKRRRTMNSIF